MSAGREPPAKLALTIRFGRFELRGAAAVALLVAIALGVVALVAWRLPHLRFGPMVASGLLWFVFVVYWSAAAARSASAPGSESPGSRALHQMLLNLSLLLLFVRVPGLGARWMPDGRWTAGAGLALQVACAATAVWARRHLGRNWSGAIPRGEGRALIRSGPYRKLRHPIYSAMIGMYFATAMISGELHGLLAFAIVGFAYARRIPPEEAALRAEFGDAWYAYRAVTWALVPGVY